MFLNCLLLCFDFSFLLKYFSFFRFISCSIQIVISSFSFKYIFIFLSFSLSIYDIFDINSDIISVVELAPFVFSVRCKWRMVVD